MLVTKRTRVTLIIFLCVVSAAVGGFLTRYIDLVTNPPTESTAEQRYYPPGEFWGLSADAWIAIFTLVLTGTTVLLWNSTSDTLDVTRSSVRAQVNGQRGKLAFLTCSKVRLTGQGVVIHLDYSFQNIGSGRVMIKTFRRNITIFPLPKPFTQKEADKYLPAPTKTYKSDTTLDTPIVMDEVAIIATEEHVIPNPQPAFLHRRIALDAQQNGALHDGDHALLVEYSIVYETAFGDYELRSSWRVKGATSGNNTRVTKPLYESDLPVGQGNA